MRKSKSLKLIHRARCKSVAPKFRYRLSASSVPAAAAGNTGAFCTRRTAVPVFMGRISPVLDACTQLILLDPDGKQAAARSRICIAGVSIIERAGWIRQHGIRVIICGAVSDFFYTLLKEAGVELICGIAGNIDDVIDAYRKGALAEPRFRMPGLDSFD